MRHEGQDLPVFVEMADLSDSERNELRRMLGNELHARRICN